MKLFRKIVCCVIMPVLAVFGLAGCGNDRNALTIQNRYIEMMKEHTDMFEKVELAEQADGSKVLTSGIKIQVQYNSDEMQKLKAINTESMYNEFETDQNLYKRYYALENLQGQILDNVFSYYQNQKEVFFSVFDEKEMDKKERKTLYNNIEDLEEDVKEFKIARDKIDNTADVLTFNGIVRADITSYSYHYNELIERCIEFVRYFKELNLKYYYPEDVELNDTNYQAYVKQYLDESIFEVNEILYYSSVKAFNNVSECDLSKVYGDISVSEGNVSVPFRNVLVGNINNGLAELVEISNSFDEDNYIYSISYINKLKEYSEARSLFLQKARVYKTVYENMDYYKYNQVFLDNIKEPDEKLMERYQEEITNVEIANITLVEEFLRYTASYCDNVNSIFNA